MPPRDVGDTVGQDPTQGSRLRPKTEQVLPGVPYLTPPGDGIPAAASNKRSDETTYHFLLQQDLLQSRKLCDEIVLAAVENTTQNASSDAVQIQYPTDRTHVFALSRTHPPAIPSVGTTPPRRRPLTPPTSLRAGGPSRRRRSFHAPATLRAADAGLMPDGPHRPTAGQPSQLTKPEKESPID